jgi:hypothetical protein
MRTPLPSQLPHPQTDLFGEGTLWDVYRFAYPFGASRRLGSIQAISRAEAEVAARSKYGHEILIEPAS